MPEPAAEWLVAAVRMYGAAGILFAVLFQWRGVDRMDAAAKGAGWGFRVVTLPATVALWPLLLRRWRKVRS